MNLTVEIKNKIKKVKDIIKMIHLLATDNTILSIVEFYGTHNSVKTVW